MTTEKLFSFIENSPTAFHAIEAMRCRLKAEGYQPLLEGSDWNLQAGGKYYVIRNGSSIIAFRIPAKEWKGFQIMASHSDSPMFKIKENPEIEAEGHYVKLNVEKYGGMLCAPWFDRPLSVAGRLVVKDGEQIVTKLVDVKKDLVMIPSLAIHMNRDANNGVPFNPQKELLPLYGDENAKGTFMEQMAALAGVARKDILAHDLYVYSRTPVFVSSGFNLKFVTDAPYSTDRPGRMIFDLFTQSLDMYVYGTGIADVFISPDMIQKLFSGKYLIR